MSNNNKGGSRKCVVDDCLSSPSAASNITFHKFPSRKEFRDNWIKAAKTQMNPTSKYKICSRHFKKSDFQEMKVPGNKKMILKQGIIPSIFPWTDDWSADVKQEEIAPQVPVPAVSAPVESSPVPSAPVRTPRSTRSTRDKKVNEVDIEKQVEEKLEAIKAECAAQESTSTTEKSAAIEPEVVKSEAEAKVEVKEETTEKVAQAAAPKPSRAPPRKNKRNKNKHTFRISFGKSVKNKKANKKKLQSRAKQKAPAKTSPPTPITSPKKQNASALNFISGTKLEAQDFNGKWHEAKIVEVDSDEREVLIHFEKNDKLSDEWIPMDSVRLRSAQPVKKVDTFVVGEKCMARWNDSRKFPATVQKIIEDDLYQVCFTDGYVKVVRGSCMTKIKQPAGYSPSKEAALIAQQEPVVPSLNNIVIPDIPKDGEWCCYWINDSPVGKEGFLEFPHGLLNTIIVDDWRLPSNWTKHLYQRTGNYTGKWDTILVNPEGRKFRSRQELKIYLDEIGQIFDPEKYDFCLHKKRAKEIGLLTYTDDFKKLSIPGSANSSLQNFDQSASDPNTTIGKSEVYVGALKVKIIDNLYLCPNCDKTFRKENHLQIHIKHYHKESAELLGVCPNMQDLAYLRTVEFEETDPQPEVQLKSRKSIQTKPVTTETTSPQKVTANKSLTSGESATKSSKKVDTIKKEKIKVESSSSALEDSSLNNSAQKSPDRGVVYKRSKVKRESILSRDEMAKATVPLKKLKLNDTTASVTDSDDTHYSCTDESIMTSNTQNETQQQPQQPETHAYVNEYGEVIKIVRMRKEEIINCICGYTEADGLMIQCEICLCWQHSICNNILKESEVPEKYICLICKNPERGRPSQRFIHDQDWLYDGKLPTAFYRQPTAKLHDRFTILQDSHTLTGNLLEIEKFLHSLQIKMNIASNKDHPKMYLWSYKWEKSPMKIENTSAMQNTGVKSLNKVKDNESEASILAGLLNTKNENKTNTNEINNDEQDDKFVPREEAIDPGKCQRVLLGHIQRQQSLAFARLQEIEAKINALDFLDQNNGSTETSQSNTISVMHRVLKDLEKMKSLAEIHASVPAN